MLLDKLYNRMAKLNTNNGSPRTQIENEPGRENLLSKFDE